MTFRSILLFGWSCMVAYLPTYGQNLDKYSDKLEAYRAENWPPLKVHSRYSLGYALQNTFKKHADYCGFVARPGKRDFVPSDITRFLGKRDLRTQVEVADIKGGGLMYYVFNRNEKNMLFNDVQFVPTRLLQPGNSQDLFEVDPDSNFDTYVLTKTCGGYLKAALDAGIEPPYSAFRAAFETDSKRESTVFALSGSFVSPLKAILDANDARTTALMFELWKFYADHPGYIGNAYYLQQFEGVMIRHVSSAEENQRLERSVGLNVNVPFGPEFQASLNVANTRGTTFSGTDWETIVYADFDMNYTKDQLFAPLPSPEEIAAYFSNLRPVYEKSRDHLLMTEGTPHIHHLWIEGMPDFMANSPWELEEVGSGVYQGTPMLQSGHYTDKNDKSSGGRFTVTGKPDPANFSGDLGNRPGKLALSYVLKSARAVNGVHIRMPVSEEIQTSAHPIATLSDGEFDLTKKENRRFALQWEFEVSVEDFYNPVDFTEVPYTSGLQVRRNEKNVEVRIARILPDAKNKKFLLTLETEEAFPLERIDDSNMVHYSMSFDIHLKSLKGGGVSVRPVKGRIFLPAVKPVIVEQISGSPILPLQRSGN